MAKSMIERFFKKVRKTKNCWIWLGDKNAKGYGRISINSKTMRAHRFSYEIHKGNLESFYVLHKCDNPSCVNPEHLFLGTQKQNIEDSVSKGRFVGGAHRRKINSKIAKKIKNLLIKGETNQKIHELLLVSKPTIRAIKTGRSWKNI